MRFALQHSVRPLLATDIAVIAALRYAAFFSDGKRSLDEDAAGLFDLLRGDGYEAAFVAEADGRPIGTCLFVRREIAALHDVTPWLAGLVVASPYRRLGIGRSLVGAVEHHAAKVGCGKLHLYTEDAEPFYHALGWKVTERMTVEGDPLILMDKAIG